MRPLLSALKPSKWDPNNKGTNGRVRIQTVAEVDAREVNHQLSPKPLARRDAKITRLLKSSKYFGTRKCCHPQISDLVIRLVFFRESSRKIINKLTSRLPSCESSIPGRFALFECNSNDVRICKKISQESCHQEIMKPKSDIWGWQHLWGPKDLLNIARRQRHAFQ